MVGFVRVPVVSNVLAPLLTIRITLLRNLFPSTSTYAAMVGSATKKAVRRRAIIASNNPWSQLYLNAKCLSKSGLDGAAYRLIPRAGNTSVFQYFCMWA